jgi:hypothetical protein
MATAAAMAALRAMAVGYCGGGSSNEDGCRDSGGKDDSNGGNGVVPIALVALAMHTSSPAMLLPMPLPVLSSLPLHLSPCNNEGNRKDGKSNCNSNIDGNGNKESDGDGGMSNDDGDKEGEGEGGKWDGDSDKEGDGKGGKGNGSGNYDSGQQRGQSRE